MKDTLLVNTMGAIGSVRWETAWGLLIRGPNSQAIRLRQTGKTEKLLSSSRSLAAVYSLERIRRRIRRWRAMNSVYLYCISTPMSLSAITTNMHTSGY